MNTEYNAPKSLTSKGKAGGQDDNVPEIVNKSNIDDMFWTTDIEPQKIARILPEPCFSGPKQYHQYYFYLLFQEQCNFATLLIFSSTLL